MSDAAENMSVVANAPSEQSETSQQTITIDKPATSSTSTTESTQNNEYPVEAKDKSSTCLIVLGMAGSGKTTFVQKLAETLYEDDRPGYLINLDPACLDMPYPANIDIRDTINYKRVMKEYELGPNGAIITSLNLFTTKFDQLVTLIEQKSEMHDHFILDTPGQIEVFNWSASGMIITESLASQMPTAVVYVMDTVRNLNPATFMSNMLYACSILYKTKLPLIVVLNKIDLQSEQYIIDWMTDFEKYLDSLEAENGFISNLNRSLALALDEFYSELKTVGVSSVSGIGMDRFLEAVAEAHREYKDVYLKERIAMKDSAKRDLISSRVSDMTLKEGAIPEEEEDDDQEAD